jgi:hypothetical protein
MWVVFVYVSLWETAITKIQNAAQPVIPEDPANYERFKVSSAFRSSLQIQPAAEFAVIPKLAEPEPKI